MIIRHLGVFTLTLFSCHAIGTAQASTLVWDNGGPAVIHQGGSNMSDTFQAEDFILTVATDLSGVTFWDLEGGVGEYNGSIFWRLATNLGGSPNDAGVIAGGTATPTRTASGTVLGFNQVRNDFSIAVNGVAAGSYWLELHNGPLTTTAFTDYYWSFAEAGGANLMSNPGQEKGLNPLTGWTTNDSEHAYNLQGTAAVVVAPEPGTTVLLLAGLAISAGLQRKYGLRHISRRNAQ
jgi:hypothetical protein